MIRSMTAFARQQAQYDWGTLAWEIRSVNHRYLELSFKLPDHLRALESILRERLRQRLTRGKVECALRQQVAPQTARLGINTPLLVELINNAETIQQKLRDSSGINPLELLQWPGVLNNAELNQEQLQEQALSLFAESIDQLLETREREGSALRTFVLDRADTIDHITGAIRQQLPVILDQQRQKLQEKVSELTAELDPARLEQEIVLLTQKADVAEELDRLDAHTSEVRRVLQQGGSCGRRLDFLMQELNREANTLSSKSIVTDTTQAAVELKVLIEQMREQIQNIE